MTKEFINLYWSTKTSACYHICCGRFVQISYRIAPRSEQMVQRNMTKSINSTTKSLQSTYLCHNDGMGMPNNRTQCSKMKIEKYTHTHRESKLFIRFLKTEPSNTIDACVFCAVCRYFRLSSLLYLTNSTALCLLFDHRLVEPK